MFLLNISLTLRKPENPNLNTSNVSIKQSQWKVRRSPVTYLNTSNVSIKQTRDTQRMVSYPYLNTSNVSIKLDNFPASAMASEFKYIQCFY